MTWAARVDDVSVGTQRVRLDEDGRVMSRADVVARWADDSAFRSFYARMLADAPFPAFFWEAPATTVAHQHLDAEVVLVHAPALARVTADPSDFDDQLERSPGADVLTFPNLGGDAVLVVPAPRGPATAYAHLAAFVRGAPPAQVDLLFRTLARAMSARLSTSPTWVSTAGLGVSWLHLRLDSRPKYYRHDPYRRLP